MRRARNKLKSRKRPSHLGKFLHPIRAETTSQVLTGSNWLHIKTGRPATDWILAFMQPPGVHAAPRSAAAGALASPSHAAKHGVTGVMDGGWRESSPTFCIGCYILQEKDVTGRSGRRGGASGHSKAREQTQFQTELIAEQERRWFWARTR